MENKMKIKFNVGDFVSRNVTTRSVDAPQFGIIIDCFPEHLIRPDCFPEHFNLQVKVCWQGDYGAFWCKARHLELLAKGKISRKNTNDKTQNNHENS